MHNVIILLPDNGRDDDLTVTVGLDGIQTGMVRFYTMAPDPARPDETIPDFTGVMNPAEVEEFPQGAGNRYRFLYCGEARDEDDMTIRGQQSL